MANPMSRLRGRFDRAIEWRVRAAIERSIGGPDEPNSGRVGPPVERHDDQGATIRSLRDDLATVSVQLTDQHRALADLVEHIDQRLTLLERAGNGS